MTIIIYSNNCRPFSPPDGVISLQVWVKGVEKFDMPRSIESQPGGGDKKGGAKNVKRGGV